MMQQNDIPFHESRLQAAGLAEVHTRLCGNLINIYSHSRNTSKQRILLDMLLAISPNNIEYSIRHAQVVITAASLQHVVNVEVFTSLLGRFRLHHILGMRLAIFAQPYCVLLQTC